METHGKQLAESNEIILKSMIMTMKNIAHNF